MHRDGRLTALPRRWLSLTDHRHGALGLPLVHQFELPEWDLTLGPFSDCYEVQQWQTERSEV